MKKFIALYKAPVDAMANAGNATKEEQAAAMQAWLTWRDNNLENIVDFGAPLLPGNNLNGNGAWQATPSEIGGYSILQGESSEAVQALFKDHPHLNWVPGCSIELQECKVM